MYSIYVYFLTLLTACSACNSESSLSAPSPVAQAYVEVTPSFQQLLDDADLTGAILLYTPQKRTYYSNDFQWARKGQLPASTFKIPNSIVALETSVIQNKDVVLSWDGTSRSIANWNQDLSFDEAFAYSCVPCYQQIARSIGYNRMRQNLDMLGYPKTVQFDTSNIDMFWLTGDARINQFEQIKFLERLYEDKLPISSSTAQTMREIMVIDTTDSYILSGKTGWSNDNGKDNGWFVGFAERLPKNNSSPKAPLLYFATNIEPQEGTPISSFISSRREVTEAAIRSLNWP